MIPEHRDRREEHVRHQEKSNQIGDVRRRTAVQRLISADQEQQRDKELIVQIQQRQEQPLRAIDHRVVLGVIAHQVAEHLCVFILPHESLGHSHTVDTFSQRRGHAAERIAHLPQRDAQFQAEMIVNHPQNRRQTQHDQKQQRVVPQHEGRGDPHLPDLHEADKQHFLHAHPHVFHVGRHAADDSSELRAMIKTHRHRLQMPEYVAPQIEHDRFTQFQRQSLPIVHYNLRRQSQHGEPQHAGDHTGNAAACNRSLDDRSNHPRERRQLNRSQYDQQNQPVPLGRIRFGVVE